MKIPRHKLVTALLAAYALFMVIYFGTDLIRAGQYLKFTAITATEAVVITLAYFALRRRNK